MAEMTVPNTTEWKAAIFRWSEIDLGTGEPVTRTRTVPIVAWRFTVNDDWNSAAPVFIDTMLPNELESGGIIGTPDYALLTPGKGVFASGSWYLTVEDYLNA